MNTTNLMEKIKSGKPLLIDSAMGTSLMKRGMKAGTLSEEYNFESIDIIKSIHLANIAAGADILTTNTFGANSLKLSEKSLNIEQTIANAVKCAKDAAGDGAWVAQDIGPIGKMLKPYGDLDVDLAKELFTEQIMLGVQSGVDLFLIETMFDLAELEIAAEQAKLHGQGRPVFCSVSIQKKDKTLMGNSISSVVNRLIDLDIEGCGINCGFGPIQMKELVPVLLESTKGKIRALMQPNAGLPKIDENNQVYYDMQPEEYNKYMVEIYNEGITILGGCCGTTPEYLKDIRTRMNEDL